MIKLPIIQTETDLFIFILHTIHEHFRDHAVLKGGMVLRLLGSKRRTIDLDYTFIPFVSKTEILDSVEKLFSNISDINYSIVTNSKAIRVNIEVGQFKSQVEINVAVELKTDVMSTAYLKNASNPIAPRIIRIMSLDVALAHKLAAWNERRLIRDLYDSYYFLGVQNIEPDLDVLKDRLSHVNSRRPELKTIKSMGLVSFMKHLKRTLESLSQDDIERELSGLLDDIELAGLAYKMKDVIGAFIRRHTR